jgi:predicted RNase H-like HicB family nuclease
MRVFEVEVTRDGDWWMITVPELDGYVTPGGAVNVGGTTQARSRDEVETMAREYISLTVDDESFGLNINMLD